MDTAAITTVQDSLAVDSFLDIEVTYPRDDDYPDEQLITTSLRNELVHINNAGKIKFTLPSTFFKTVEHLVLEGAFDKAIDAANAIAAALMNEGESAGEEMVEMKSKYGGH